GSLVGRVATAPVDEAKAHVAPLVAVELGGEAGPGIARRGLVEGHEGDLEAHARDDAHLVAADLVLEAEGALLLGIAEVELRDGGEGLARLDAVDVLGLGRRRAEEGDEQGEEEPDPRHSIAPWSWRGSSVTARSTVPPGSTTISRSSSSK